MEGGRTISKYRSQIVEIGICAGADVGAPASRSLCVGDDVDGGLKFSQQPSELNELVSFGVVFDERNVWEPL